MKFYFIYALTRDDIVFYIGKTENLNRRLIEHKKTYGVNIKITKVAEYYVNCKEIFLIENEWIKRYIDSGVILLNKSTALPILETKKKCIQCDKIIYNTGGKREKIFCNSSCRSKFWLRKKMKAKKDEQEKNILTDTLIPKIQTATPEQVIEINKAFIKQLEERYGVLNPLNNNPKTLEELKKLCPKELVGFDKGAWISENRLKFNI